MIKIATVRTHSRITHRHTRDLKCFSSRFEQRAEKQASAPKPKTKIASLFLSTSRQLGWGHPRRQTHPFPYAPMFRNLISTRPRPVYWVSMEGSSHSGCARGAQCTARPRCSLGRSEASTAHNCKTGGWTNPTPSYRFKLQQRKKNRSWCCPHSVLFGTPVVSFDPR